MVLSLSISPVSMTTVILLLSLQGKHPQEEKSHKDLTSGRKWIIVFYVFGCFFISFPQKGKRFSVGNWRMRFGLRETGICTRQKEKILLAKKNPVALILHYCP